MVEKKSVWFLCMWNAHFTQLNKHLLLQKKGAFLYVYCACNVAVYMNFNHGHSTFLWQRATPTSVDWFADCTWKT
jgi:hypothetical protein